MTKSDKSDHPHQWKPWCFVEVVNKVQSGRSSLAKHGGAYFSAIYGSIEDPIAVPGPYENQEV